jgi:hypothetical protein
LRLGPFTMHIAESFLEGSRVGLLLSLMQQGETPGLLPVFSCLLCLGCYSEKNLGITWRLWTLTVVPYLIVPACCSVVLISVCDGLDAVGFAYWYFLSSIYSCLRPDVLITCCLNCN